MPELPEVETVRKKMLARLKNKKICGFRLYHDDIFDKNDICFVKANLIGQNILDIKRRGKWLIFELDDFYLLSHLRMEGKYVYRDVGASLEKHHLVIFNINNEFELRYKDVRKFGKMQLITKDKMKDVFSNLGFEPWDDNLKSDYLLSIFSKRRIPIKTLLLDQSIIAGIGNIYADEILFLSGINPHRRGCDVSLDECSSIIKNTRVVLSKAIDEGGTTIRSYTSEEGVVGGFQNNLFVHMREGKKCKRCSSIILCDKINGRSSYYCKGCQK